MIGASAIGVPGWPELAFWTASIDNVRMVLMHSSSSVRVSVVVLIVSLVSVSLPLKSARPSSWRGQAPGTDHTGIGTGPRKRDGHSLR